MIISLIGMSGSGKTYWSKQLEQTGFARFCCDDLIEEKLEMELRKYGYSGIADVAKWMGQPSEENYLTRSKRYLELERKVMETILQQIPNYHQKDLVIDTTGSVIYTGEEILHRLSELTRIIYIDTPLSVQEEMYRLYASDPKPVIWGESFNQRDDESEYEALERCYQELLKYRSRFYEKYAEVKIKYEIAKDVTTSVDAFLNQI